MLIADSEKVDHEMDRLFGWDCYQLIDLDGEGSVQPISDGNPPVRSLGTLTNHHVYSKNLLLSMPRRNVLRYDWNVDTI